MKTIGIIGATGMLGADLVTSFKKQFSVTAITKENYHSFLRQKFDVLINANGNSKRFWANKHIVEDFALSTTSVYKSLFDFTFNTYIYISSSDVYEHHANKKYTKENQHITPENLSPYGLHKYISELLVKKHAPEYLVLRCSMILGKRLKKGPIYDILNKKDLFISQSSCLQMITTQEIANIIATLLKKKMKNTIYNVGGKGTVHFKNITDYISLPATFSPDAEMQEYEMNIAKLHKLYPLKTSGEYLQKYLKSIT